MNSQVDEPLGLQSMILRRTTKLPTMPLAPRPQKATPPFLHVPVDLPEGRAWVTEAKVISPTTEKPVHLRDEFLRRQLNLPLGHLAQPVLHSIHRLSRRDYIQIPSRTKLISIKAKGKTQKIKAFTFLSQVNDTCLIPVQIQPQSIQHPIDIVRHSDANVVGQNDKIIRIPHQLCLNCPGWTTPAIKLPIQLMQENVGQQRRDHSP